jgi:hypothetical protein
MLLPLLNNLRMLGSWVQWDTHDGNKSKAPIKKDTIRQEIERAYKSVFNQDAPKVVVKELNKVVFSLDFDSIDARMKFIADKINAIGRMKKDDESLLLLLA